MTRILIIYATSHGHTRQVAQTIADRLRALDFRVQMVALHRGDTLPDLASFDAFVLGSRVHFGKLDSGLRTFVARNRGRLVDKPSYLFSVGMAAVGTHASPDPVIERWCKLLVWTPRASAAFGGALMYRSYNPFVRLFMQLMSRRGGHPTDTSRDYVFTDWAAVAMFADDIARGVGHLQPIPAAGSLESAALDGST